jgi:hypothetical protein
MSARRRGERLTAPLALAGALVAAAAALAPAPAAATSTIPDFQSFCRSAYPGSRYVRAVARNGFAPTCNQRGKLRRIDAARVCRWWSGAPAYRWETNRRNERYALRCARARLAHLGAVPPKGHRPARKPNRDELGALGPATGIGPRQIEGCGWDYLTDPQRLEGEAPSPCPNLHGGIVVSNLGDFCAFFDRKAKRYVHYERAHGVAGKIGDWERRELVWHGDAPTCKITESVNGEVQEHTRAMNLAAVCYHARLRRLGYRHWGLRGADNSYPVITNPAHERGEIYIRYVGRTLTCFHYPRGTRARWLREESAEAR